MQTALPLAQKAATLFAERGFENARLEAELLLAAVLGMKRLELYTQFDRPVQTAELERFRAFVRRRLRHEPLQYIVGDTQFRSLRLRVDPRALIPRPETEVLVGVVLAHLRDRDAAAAYVLDLGTGTGAIALSLLAEGDIARAVATDVSPDALALAAENAALLGLVDRLELRCGDLWEAVPPAERYHVIVSNPPYVDAAGAAALAPEVREHEPAMALFAPDGGRAVLDRIVAEAHAHLVQGGMLALELAPEQAATIAERMTATGHFEAVTVTPDLAGRARIVSGLARQAISREDRDE